MLKRIPSSCANLTVRRPLRRLGAAVTALAVTSAVFGAGSAAAADIPPPPRAKLNVYGLNVSGAWNAARGYCTISARAKGTWNGPPKRIGATNGHYISVTTEVITPGGSGGSLIKSLEKTNSTSRTFFFMSDFPRNFSWAAHYNAAQGSGDYGARITVRVIRNVVAAPDTTAWKLVAKTSYKSGFCNSGGGGSFSPNPAPALPGLNPGGG